MRRLAGWRVYSARDERYDLHQIEILIAWAAAPAVFVLGWYLLGYGEARAAGLVNLVAGTLLLAIAVLGPVAKAIPLLPASVALVVGLYLAAEGAVAIWNLGSRTLGMLAGFGAVALAVLGLLQLLDVATAEQYRLGGATFGLATALFVLPLLLRFMELGLERPTVRRLAGWAFILSAWIGWAIPAAVLVIDTTFF